MLISHEGDGGPHDYGVAENSVAIRFVRYNLFSNMAASDSTLQQQVHHLIGRPGAPIHLLKDKSARAEIARQLKDKSSGLSPESRLRASLAIGRIPDIEVTDSGLLERALSAEDCASFVARLAVKRSVLDAQNVLTALAALIAKSREIRLLKTAAALCKAMTKWHAQRARSPLEVSSVRAYATTVEAMLRKAKQTRSSGRKEAVKLDAILLTLVSFAILEVDATGKGSEAECCSNS